MLSVKERQEYLKYLGYYTGSIDGKVGPKTKQAYKKLQNDYFFRKSDKDGLYGPNTDKLLVDVYRVKRYTKNFDIKRDQLYCRCKGKYCTGYPAYIDTNLLENLQAERDYSGATTVTSMLRCKEWNKLQGGVPNSKHLKGKAVDYRNSRTRSLAGRKECINYWFKLKEPSYSYCNGWYRSTSSSGYKKSTSMGTSVHGDVK